MITWGVGLYLISGILFTFYLEINLKRDSGTGFGILNRIQLIFLWPVSAWSWIKLWIKYLT